MQSLFRVLLVPLVFVSAAAGAQTTNIPDPLTKPTQASASPGSYQYGISMLKLDKAWEVTKGRSLLTVYDTGMLNHPELASGVGGNFRSHLSSGVSTPVGVPQHHGLIVAGVMAARGFNGQGISGSCPWCSFNYVAYSGADTLIEKAPPVAINMSIGSTSYATALRLQCESANYGDPSCLKYRRWALLDTAMVSIAQNEANRGAVAGDGIAYPALHPDVIAVGGMQADGRFWSQGYEETNTGSNWGQKMRLVAPAKDVLSLQLVDKYLYDYKPLRCGDRVDSSVSADVTLPLSYSGYGTCSGTSFSGPFVTGVIGLMRSANPLLTNTEVKTLLYETATTPVAGPDGLTFYIPNAEAAVRAALNRGRTGLSASFSNNRLTPMFGIYSQAEQSHLFTSSPQIALGVLTNSAGATSVGESIVGYPQFSGRNCDNTLTSCKTASARAMFSLFATENAPAGAILQPLYRLVKGGSKAYLTDFQKALALERDGYAMEVVEGYVYEATQSRPTGTVSLCTATDSARRDVILYVSNSACDQTRLTYGNSMTTGGNYANNTLLGYVQPLQPTQTTAPPNAGWWWRADESGRGFFIEQQGHTVFVSGYLYEADGRPTWFIATGKAENGEFLGKIQTASGGQALNGPYRVPTVRETNDQIRLKFDGQERAQLSWPGGATTITRFDYGGSGRQSLPDSGWWWAENESGRGYSIEIQGDTLFFAAYMYNDRGEPVWYTAAGKLSDGKRFSGDLLLSESGQAMTAPYRAPTTRSIGAIKLVFDSATKGLLTLPDGRDLVISRFKFSEY